MVYDVTNEASIEQLALWRDELKNRVGHDGYFPIVVVGNKIDMRTEENGVDQKQVLDWCQDYKYGHVETSAKDDHGVHAAMTAVAALALEQMKEAGQGMTGARSSRDSVLLQDMYSEPRSKCGGCL